MANSKSSKVIFDTEREKSGYVGDLGMKTVTELTELLERQCKLLSNKSFINKLPDKGNKIKKFKTQLEKELRKRDDISDTCISLAHLNIKTTDELEWTDGQKFQIRNLDSDDESDTETDPLKLLATHSGTVKSSNKKIIRSVDSLITENDLSDIKSFQSDKHVQNLCEKYGDVNVKNEMFKPFRLKEPDKVCLSAEKVKNRLGDKWEVSAATDPVLKFGQAKCLSLSESLLLQKKQEEKLMVLQTKQATDKLLQFKDLKLGSKLPENNIDEYRNNQVSNEEDEINSEIED